MNIIDYIPSALEVSKKLNNPATVTVEQIFRPIIERSCEENNLQYIVEDKCIVLFYDSANQNHKSTTKLIDLDEGCIDNPTGTVKIINSYYTRNGNPQLFLIELCMNIRRKFYLDVRYSKSIKSDRWGSIALEKTEEKMTLSELTELRLMPFKEAEKIITGAKQD